MANKFQMLNNDVMLIVYDVLMDLISIILDNKIPFGLSLAVVV